jgi:hypothetical protein
MDPLIQGLLIGFFGSGLYVAVDKYEPERTIAFVFKCLVVMWGGAGPSIVRACLALDFSNLECGTYQMLDIQHRHSPVATWNQRAGDGTS